MYIILHNIEYFQYCEFIKLYQGNLLDNEQNYLENLFFLNYKVPPIIARFFYTDIKPDIFLHINNISKFNYFLYNVSLNIYVEKSNDFKQKMLTFVCQYLNKCRLQSDFFLEFNMMLWEICKDKYEERLILLKLCILSPQLIQVDSTYSGLFKQYFINSKYNIDSYYEINYLLYNLSCDKLYLQTELAEVYHYDNNRIFDVMTFEHLRIQSAKVLYNLIPVARWLIILEQINNQDDLISSCIFFYKVITTNQSDYDNTQVFVNYDSKNISYYITQLLYYKMVELKHKYTMAEWQYNIATCVEFKFFEYYFNPYKIILQNDYNKNNSTHYMVQTFKLIKKKILIDKIYDVNIAALYINQFISVHDLNDLVSKFPYKYYVTNYNKITLQKHLTLLLNTKMQLCDKTEIFLYQLYDGNQNILSSNIIKKFKYYKEIDQKLCCMLINQPFNNINIYGILCSLYYVDKLGVDFNYINQFREELLKQKLKNINLQISLAKINIIHEVFLSYIITKYICAYIDKSFSIEDPYSIIYSYFKEYLDKDLLTIYFNDI